MTNQNVITEYEKQIKEQGIRYEGLRNERDELAGKYQELQNERVKEEEEKANDNDDRIKSVLDKLDEEFTKFKENYNEEKLQRIMNETPDKLLDKQSLLSTELNNYKQCVDGIIISSKSFDKYIQDIDGIIDKLSSPDLVNYKQWGVDTILIWIRGLENGRYNQHIDTLRNGFNESGITGEDLPDLTRSDLTLPPFNLKNFKDKRDLEKHFKSLKHPPIMHNEADVADEGAPTAYI